MLLIVLITAILCMVIANYMWQRERNRKKEEHERRMERFDRLMELLKKPNSDKEAQVPTKNIGSDDSDEYRTPSEMPTESVGKSDTTEDEENS